MVSKNNTLSSYTSTPFSSNITGLSFKQFKRTYSGNFAINFALCLSATNDIRTKNFSNFYLTNNFKFSDVFDYDSSKFKAQNIYGPISFGSEFLSYDTVNPLSYTVVGEFQSHRNYAVPTFGNDGTNFNIVIKDNNICNIYYRNDNKRFYLCLNSNNELFFVKETLLSFNTSSVNPQDFTYLYSESDNFILFFKKTQTQNLFLTKYGNSLTALPVYDDNITTFLSNPFKIAKDIYSYPNVSFDTTFITYNSDNTINLDKSELDLHNNFLIHNKYSDETTNSNIIVLKNQLLQNDVFSSANNLLSSGDYNSYTDNLRDYTCIGEDIKEEESDDLILNYVFYNKPYLIRPGTNTFISPSSMYPFETLNINDSKFVFSGAYSHTTPQYADKIYHISDNVTAKNNGQYLLCTWLSGSPFSNDKVWVDRYYYPDIIEKAVALSSKPITEVTYDDYIEQLIQSNTSLKSEVTNRKFFDKLSDLAFEPNQTYVYDRINTTEVSTMTANTVSYCSNVIATQPNNYFKTINSNGEMTIAFNFLGDSSDWTLASDRNNIDSGLSITKTNNKLQFVFKMYDSSSFENSGAFFTATADKEFKPLKNNFVCISVNVKTGVGYFFLNDSIVSNFEIPIFEYLIKQILYGDFFWTDGINSTNAFLVESPISNFQASSEYTDPDIAFSLAVSNFNLNIDDLVISLPCGMCNSSDNIDILNSVCGSSIFKSNNINIYLKNLNIDDSNIVQELKDSIRSNIASYLPANTQIKNIEIVNFK